MPLFATSGSQLFIGPASSLFSPSVWTEVKSVLGLGRIVGNWKTVATEVPNFETLQVETVVEKAVPPVRDMQIVVATDVEDEGQEMLLLAESSEEQFAFRVDLSDGSCRQFLALVIGMEDAFDEANAVMTMVFSLTIAGPVERTNRPGGG